MENQNLQQLVEKNVIEYEQMLLIDQYNKRLNSNNVPIIYNLRHLRKLIKIKKKDQSSYFGSKRKFSYREFSIPKKNGSKRLIQAPNDDLKQRQTWIKENILDKFSVSENAKGFLKGRSIIDNAIPHVGKELVINIDIKDFFPSIKYNRIYRLFIYIGYTCEVAHLLTKICTNSDDVLPQGSPASPVISNLVSLKLDKRLANLAKSSGAEYTRYADDITFSGKKQIKSLYPKIIQIIVEEGFYPNFSKSRLQYSFQHQDVTGLIVNTKLSVPKRIIKELDNVIYYGSRYGIADHLNKIHCTKSLYKEHIYGLAYFVHMVDSLKGEKYLRLLDELNWAY